MEQQFFADSYNSIKYVGNKMPEKSSFILNSFFNKGFAVSIVSKIEVLGFSGNDNEL